MFQIWDQLYNVCTAVPIKQIYFIRSWSNRAADSVNLVEIYHALECLECGTAVVSINYLLAVT